ncbi:MAG: extracellular solute-binding protein [Burkholderiales bacterium]|nr:extracellular solute-binding protein [Burkholderiales bacterium]
MSTVLRGLNWAHRRAQGPMDAAARAIRTHLGVAIEWDAQDLAGFEHGLDSRIADRFDLVVFDHPFCGDIAAQGLMRPLDDVLGNLHDDAFVGASLDSYRYAGQLWALPVDGATQCALARPDLMAHFPLPAAWDEVLALGQQLRTQDLWLGLATASPHGIMVLLALCANLGHPLRLDPWATPFDRMTLRTAAGLLKAVAALARPDGAAMNAIHLHDAMVRDDDIAYSPAVYAYLTYGEQDQRVPLRFAGFPGPNRSVGGTVLGGTGIGISRACRDVAAAERVIRYLADAKVQRDLIMGHHGQPASALAWFDPIADARYGGAHAAIAATMARAWTRPRFPGYIRWQHAAGGAVERFLAGALTLDAFEHALTAQWRRCAPALG